jgi:AraC-like DNA-binding protein
MDSAEITSAEQLRTVMRAEFAPVSFVTSRPQFEGLLASRDLGDGVALIDVRSRRVDQTPRLHLKAQPTTREMVFFGTHTAGSGRVRQHGRVATVAPGDGVLYESERAFELGFPVDMQGYTLVLPRELLKMRSAVITDRCAHTVSRQWSSTRLLSGYLRQLAKVADGLSADQRRDAGRVAVDLLGMALRDVEPAMPHAAADVLVEMMCSHVRERVSDSTLDVAELARRHHISTRYAHTLFERIRVTPAAYIREQRLGAARALLSDPAHDRVPLEQIAAAAGFAELRTLQRGFRRRYGMSPDQWRRASRHAD